VLPIVVVGRERCVFSTCMAYLVEGGLWMQGDARECGEGQSCATRDLPDAIFHEQPESDLGLHS
jgi:hypothetical protein